MPVTMIALQHHQCIDGSDYPRGVYGENVLVERRRFSVAEVAVAMIGIRSYRAGLRSSGSNDER